MVLLPHRLDAGVKTRVRLPVESGGGSNWLASDGKSCELELEKVMLKLFGTLYSSLTAKGTYRTAFSAIAWSAICEITGDVCWSSTLTTNEVLALREPSLTWRVITDLPGIAL